jgi:rhodanese-related sulfurtransferase
MKLYLPLLYSVLYITLFAVMSCTSGETAKVTLAPKEFNKQLQSQQGVLLDVRTPEEFNEARLPGAQNIDYKSDSFEASLSQLDKSKTYFVYCKAGVRSEKAVETMQKMGFTAVYHMDGGIDAWKKEELPTNN